MNKTLLLALLGAAGCGDDGAKHLADAPPPADAAPDAFTCPPATGAGTTHTGNISAAETWTAAGSPHEVPGDISVNAALTIEACATVLIGDDHNITVRQTGSLTAAGLPGLPVTFDALVAGASWSTLSATGGGKISLAYTDLKGGGDPVNTLPSLYGELDIAGSAGPAENTLHVDHVTITGSESQGVNLHDGGGFDASSTALTITGSAGAPIVTFARLLGTIPPGTYTGNAEDAILIRGTGGPEAMAESATMHDRGVPYRVGINANAVLDVGTTTGITIPTLTIEPGVTLKFSAGATMRIDAASGTQLARGALIASGTAAKPIVFTSAAATPAAGDWYGIWFGQQPQPTTVVSNARIEYAGKISVSGGDSCVPAGQVGPNDAAIRVFGGVPTSQFVTNTVIVASGRHGIDRGWRSDSNIDFTPTNTFTTVAGCAQTQNKSANGACPSTGSSCP